MTRFRPVVTDFWRLPFDGRLLHQGDELSVVVNSELEESERVTVLTMIDDGRTAVAVRPEVADALADAFIEGDALGEESLRARLLTEGIVLHGADNIYYLAEDAHESVLAEPLPADIRRLGTDDAERFADFQAGISAQDLEDAQVELDDWAVLGVLDADGRILSAGSMYPWEDDCVLADIGVLTLADARGRGHARRLVRAMCRFALEEGYEPQYRCQLDNAASNALAGAAGLALFGRWQIVTPEVDENGPED
ncbi:hypothetical protein C5N14_29765 [Micromonospora sp. MW-13]|nr:hypothetical protein C5N14_29765 [Micromonospora sp. MW-13]